MSGCGELTFCNDQIYSTEIALMNEEPRSDPGGFFRFAGLFLLETRNADHNH